MQGIAFELLQKSKLRWFIMEIGGENTGKISYGVDRQRSDEQRNGTVRSRKATDGRSNAPQCNGTASIRMAKYSNGKALNSKERTGMAMEKQR